MADGLAWHVTAGTGGGVGDVEGLASGVGELLAAGLTLPLEIGVGLKPKIGDQATGGGDGRGEADATGCAPQATATMAATAMAARLMSA